MLGDCDLVVWWCLLYCRVINVSCFIFAGALFPCQMKSNCICVHCAIQFPLTPESKGKKNKAGKKFDFVEGRILELKKKREER